MHADSFLYRCGHMCACYDCGLELQCTSGKCPICEDPILDVVRACAYGD
ncbi:putative Zinc finger, RING/FYVE/PHD-type [Helianthus debilis subsp. tardiflorus]